MRWEGQSKGACIILRICECGSVFDPRNVRVHSLQSVSVSFSMHSVASWGLVDLRSAAKWSSFDLLISFNGNYDEKASGIFVTASIMN